jgi:hypothetical protein
MDSSALLARKKEVIQATNSLGWLYMKQMAEEAIAAMVDKAIAEEDATKGENLRRKAQAAREFWRLYLTHIEAFRQVEAETESADLADENWYEVAY